MGSLPTPTSTSVAPSTSTAPEIRPAQRVAELLDDVWNVINTAAAATPVKPLVHLGQGFFGFNPPQFVLDAAKEALNHVENNQYAPTKGRPRLRKAIADAYGPFFNRRIDPDTEVQIGSGANETIFCCLLAFVEQGSEPFFDQYLSNINIAGGVLKYVPLHPPARAATETVSAADWKIDMAELEAAITPGKTRMIIINSPHNPTGKVFSRSELEAICALCVQHNILILSDDVYDRLSYTPFTRIATLSPAIARLTLTVGSVGKVFYATGWRLGWLIARPELVKYVTSAHARVEFCSNTPLQEAAAVGFEQAEQHDFWNASKRDLQAKEKRFNAIWPELGLPYTVPDGGYFTLVHFGKLQMPADYHFPPHIADRGYDFKAAYFLIQEIGVASIPPSEFYSVEHRHVAQAYLRFAFCKNDDVLDLAKERLRGLKRYIER